MITFLIRLYLALASTHTLDAHTLEAHDEHAHNVCEVALYGMVAPQLPDDSDETTPLGEALAEVLCRNDPAPTVVVDGCVCVYDESQDCDVEECLPEAPWVCTGDADADACARAVELDAPEDCAVDECPNDCDED